MTLDEILDEIRPKSSTVLLSFSGGKDAWACWCALKDKIDFVPFFYYGGPPGLEIVELMLDYAEKKMGKHIYTYPAPMMYRLLSPENCGDQPPYRAFVLQFLGLVEFTHEDVQSWAIEDAKLPKGTYTALGVRAKDSARRALHFKKHGPISHNKKKFYPVWDWDKDKVINELKRHDVKLPIDYKLFGRSFDGLYYLYLIKLKEHFPSDYQKILEWFPLIDMEIYRYEKRKALGY